MIGATALYCLSFVYNPAAERLLRYASTDLSFAQPCTPFRLKRSVAAAVRSSNSN